MSTVEKPSDAAPAPAAADNCVEILLERLRSRPGVLAIEASFREGTLRIRYQPTRISLEELNTLGDEVGVLISQRLQGCDRHGDQSACRECTVQLAESRPGLTRDFDASTAHGRVSLSRRMLPAESAEVVRPLVPTKPWGASLSGAEQAHYAKNRAMAMLTASCLVLLVAGMVLGRLQVPAAVVQVVYGLAALCGGWFALRNTLRALSRFQFDVNLLMILAAIGAGAIGYVFEAAVLMFLFSLSNTLEVYTMGRTRRALHALLKLRPARALVMREGREVEVEAESVRPGERVVVKPGDAIPVDGDVLSGASLVDQSSLTGESVPVAKQPGDPVFAGTLNQQGAIVVTTTRAAGDTTLARIVALVQEAQAQKSRTEEVAEWVGRYYTVVVMVGAGLMIVVPPFLLHQPFASSFYRAMTLLVVASPCALVIATPATILSAIANAARNGVLFKGGRYIEALGRVRAVALDKTGTLTRGRFEVTDVIGLVAATPDDVLTWAASAETRSQHPLAQAVVRAAEARGLAFTPAEQLTSHLGKGLVGKAGGATIEVGTPELFAGLGIAVPAGALEQVQRLSREARTSMLVRRGGSWGVIAAADQVRPEAAAVVRELKRLGVRRVVMLSGDRPDTVAALAAQAGVDEAHGALLPEDKVNLLARIEQTVGPVAMVGDGVNDAPALARASVGVAMGGIGSDAAMESADLVLMSDDLSALPFALRLARHARTVVIQNVAVASGVMLVLVGLVFFGNLRLPVAVTGHEGSTVVVILNGLRLLGERRTR